MTSSSSPTAKHTDERRSNGFPHRWVQVMLAVTVIVSLGIVSVSLAESGSEAAEPGKEVSNPPGTHGSYVTLTTAYSTKLIAYTAGPANAARGVVLIHDRWGPDSSAVEWADRFAALGYRVVLPDLYDGRTVGDADAGAEVWSQIDPEWIHADLTASLVFLMKVPRRVVTVGWGTGAPYAVWLASQAPERVVGIIAYQAAAHAGTLADAGVLRLDVKTPYELLDPREQGGAATDDAWRATRGFLSRVLN
jgi:dienelactone hydrolase